MPNERNPDEINYGTLGVVVVVDVEIGAKAKKGKAV
jgi:hypothetical protein